MDPTGILDLRKGILFYIIGPLLFFLSLLPLIGGRSLQEAYISLGLLTLFIIMIFLAIILSLLGLMYTWKGFSKIQDRFNKAIIGKIGTILVLFGGVGSILLGIAYFFLGKALNNNKVKLGGILFIFPIASVVGAILIFQGLTQVARQVRLIQ